MISAKRPNGLKDSWGRTHVVRWTRPLSGYTPDRRMNHKYVLEDGVPVGKGASDRSGDTGDAGEGHPALQREPPALILRVSNPKGFLCPEGEGGRRMKEGEVGRNDGHSPRIPLHARAHFHGVDGTPTKTRINQDPFHLSDHMYVGQRIVGVGNKQ